MKHIFLLTALLFIPAGMALADAQAVFTDLSGKVQVKDAKAHKAHKAHKAKIGDKVLEGDEVLAGADAKATLRAFDGSQLTVDPNTTFQVSKLKQVGAKDKVLQFKLEVGKLLAKVTKLFSSSSSFEVEAGGVICGVRGTEFTMAYNPTTGKVDVFVTEGTVWSQGNGQSHTFTGGQGGSFQHGTWSFPAPPPNNTGNNQGPHTFFITTNPFYGFNGTGGDDFNNPLTNLPGGLPGVTGGINGTGIVGVGQSNILSLQLHFPQYNNPQ